MLKKAMHFVIYACAGMHVKLQPSIQRQMESKLPNTGVNENVYDVKFLHLLSAQSQGKPLICAVVGVERHQCERLEYDVYCSNQNAQLFGNIC